MAPPTTSMTDASRLTAVGEPTGYQAAPAQNGYDGDALDRLADELADRIAMRLGAMVPAQPEPLVDAAEIARICGKTRSWAYEHAGELGAIRLGSGPRPRLVFSAARVAAMLEKVEEPTPLTLPSRAKPHRR
jgi:hypothetical protein